MDEIQEHKEKHLEEYEGHYLDEAFYLECENLLSDFEKSSESAVIHYNQEYQQLTDTAVRISQLNNDVAACKARAAQIEKYNIFCAWAVIILLICRSVYGLVNNQDDTLPIEWIIAGFLIFLFTWTVNASAIRHLGWQIHNTVGLAANLLIGIEQDIFQLFENLRKLESLDWEKEPDYQAYRAKCRKAKLSMVRSLINKHKFPTAHGRYD